MENQLRQSQKVEAIGRLAGGVAHDFNNLLTAINGYSSMALAEMDPSHPLYVPMSEILRSGERAAGLTKQLLAYSRKQVLEAKLWNLNVIVEDLQKMLKRLIGADVELVTALAPDIGLMKVDRGQVEQIILNLVVNARDAMPQGGLLTVKTGRLLLEPGSLGTHLVTTPGPHVMLAVSDTGTGMPPEVTARLFEPFFTTKEVGKGTGLGLSVVYGIVKQSSGSISVYSDVGKGTTFKIYFPEFMETKESEGDSLPAERLGIYRGGETILLVEDDVTVRMFTRHALESLGYSVFEAGNGNEALKILKGSAQIHLVITDVVLPEMSGPVLAKRLSKSHPSLPVLFISGYAGQILTQGAVKTEEELFLEKPFSPIQLAKKVRAVLDGAVSPGG